MKLIDCLLYLALSGIVFFVLGRLLPKRWFHPDRGPWRSFVFEKEGRLYERLKIKRWQNFLPDMSRILPGVMPAKKMGVGYTAAQLDTMIRETCVAELTHVLLCLAALPCLVLWRGPGGAAVFGVYVLGNLPFILIQRYNRPRLRRLYARQKKQEDAGKCER